MIIQSNFIILKEQTLSDGLLKSLPWIKPPQRFELSYRNVQSGGVHKEDRGITQRNGETSL